MKIGIYAGTFDPIHEGHIQFAQVAIRQAGLDKVIVVAEKEPYRKKPHASWDHRQAMIERATEPLEAVDHDYAFAAQLAHKHTMEDILQVAKNHYKDEHEYWFLVGSDTFEHMHKWHNVVTNEHYGGFVVALKDDHSREWLDQKIEALKQGGFDFNIVVVDETHSKASSSLIREAITTCGTAEYENERVAHYIRTHNLYR